MDMHMKSSRQRRKPRSSLTFLLGCVSLAAISPAMAGPDGGVVVAGSAAFETLEGGDPIGVNQTSSSAIIEWQSFDLGTGESFSFNQPNAQSVTLNRVLGEGASSIDGTLTANGNIFIINGDGVLFGANSIIDVNGLLASSMDIANADFMAGDFNFQFLGNEGASVISRGDITVADAGIIAFVAPNVSVEGEIAARLGTVSLAAGDRFTIDFFGDGLVVFSPDIASGENTGGITVTGAIHAEGGAIYLTVTDALEYVETIINVEADLIARSATQEGGKIILTGSDSTTITVDATLDASGGNGGEITIIGNEVIVTENASLLANGFAADPLGALWTFQNSGFGGADTGAPLTGSFIYNADTGMFSDIMVVSGAGATLPGANYITTGLDTAPNLIDFLSTTNANIDGAYRLQIGFDNPFTNAGGTLNIAFGAEWLCNGATCFFPGFGPEARGLIGPTSVVGTTIPIVGSQNGGEISVISNVRTTFAGLASVEPGETTGMGGSILLSSGGILDFTGETRIGAPPRAGMLTLMGASPTPPVDPKEEEKTKEAVSVSLSEIASTPQSNATPQNSGGGDENNGDDGNSVVDTVFENESIFDENTDGGNTQKERRLMCLLGVAQGACSAR